MREIVAVKTSTDTLIGYVVEHSKQLKIVNTHIVSMQAVGDSQIRYTLTPYFMANLSYDKELTFDLDKIEVYKPMEAVEILFIRKVTGLEL